MQRSTEIITQRPWAVASKQDKGTAKGLEVIIFCHPLHFKIQLFYAIVD